MTSGPHVHRERQEMEIEHADRFDACTRAYSRRALLRATAGDAMVVAGGTVIRRTAAQDATPGTGVMATPCPATTTEESEAIARAYFDAFNSGDADALDALLADDYVHQGALVAQQDRALR